MIPPSKCSARTEGWRPVRAEHLLLDRYVTLSGLIVINIVVHPLIKI